MTHVTITTTPTRRRRRPGPAARRFGYVVALLVIGALLYATNVRPGWEKVSFLTAETKQVLVLVNTTLAVGAVANALYVVADGLRFRALGDVVTTSVGMAAMILVWRVFPFDVASSVYGWGLLARILLAVGIVGSAVAILAALSTLLRWTGPGSAD